MFSVTNTEVKVFPLCTMKVCPTKSGVTIERRAQVFTGFFTPDVFILSIFSRRCGATNGPFFRDLAIKLFLPAVLHDEAIARFVFRAGLKAFRELSPWTDRMMPSAATLRFSLAAAHRVIDWVHGHAAHMRTPALPARATGLAARHVHVIDIANLTDRRETCVVNPANFARRKFHQCVTGLAVAQRRLLPGATRNLSAATRRDLDVVDV